VVVTRGERNLLLSAVITALPLFAVVFLYPGPMEEHPIPFGVALAYAFGVTAVIRRYQIADERAGKEKWEISHRTLKVLLFLIVILSIILAWDVRQMREAANGYLNSHRQLRPSATSPTD
jgi:hypothetical protein